MTACVPDLSVDELRVLIQEVVRQTLKELFRDLDEGLELREDFRSELQTSIGTAQEGGELLSPESVASQLELEWLNVSSAFHADRSQEFKTPAQAYRRQEIESGETLSHEAIWKKMGV